MSEEGRVEIEADLDGFGPRDPVLELRGAQLVAVHLAAGHFGIAGVQVEAVNPRQDGKGLLEVRPELLRCAGFARVVSGDGQSAAERLAGVLEAAHIIALPAMDGNRDVGDLLQCSVGVHAQGGIAFFGEAIGLFNLLGGAHIYRFKMISDS